MTTSYEALREADAGIVCVPTPLSKTRDPNLSYIVSAITLLKCRGQADPRIRHSTSVLVILAAASAAVLPISKSSLMCS